MEECELSKQLSCQKYIFKIHTSRLKRENWNLTLPLVEARNNDEIISLADSQMLRWLDELNGITDAEERAKEIKKEIRFIRKQENSITNKRRIHELYNELDKIQFKPDYLYLIIDSVKDYYRACKGFSINGIRYKRLLGTVNGVKNETIVFISERHIDEIRRRIENGRNPEVPLSPAKLEAYKALTCSASSPVSLPRGILVVEDVETEFYADTVFINDEAPGEPTMEYRSNEKTKIDASDGFGLMLPSLAKRWSEELGLDYVVSGANSRFSFEKGMIFTFDFLEFAEKIAGRYIVKDAWGDERDIRNVELVLTTSMLKLWNSYSCLEEYLSKCKENKYTFGISKTCPKELESERYLNYQFIQSYELDDNDVRELITPTLNEMKDVLFGDINKTMIFLNGAGLNEKNIQSLKNTYVKALMIDPQMINDTYVRNTIFQLIKNKINQAKFGVLKVHGNYSIVSGDPYLLCQHIFGLKTTGLLTAGEIYNEYWSGRDIKDLACFRAPMTCHNNIRLVHPVNNERVNHWYRYMRTCTVFNGWDTATAALNG